MVTCGYRAHSSNSRSLASLTILQWGMRSTGRLNEILETRSHHTQVCIYFLIHILSSNGVRLHRGQVYNIYQEFRQPRIMYCITCLYHTPSMLLFEVTHYVVFITPLRFYCNAMVNHSIICHDNNFIRQTLTILMTGWDSFATTKEITFSHAIKISILFHQVHVMYVHYYAALLLWHGLNMVHFIGCPLSVKTLVTWYLSH